MFKVILKILKNQWDLILTASVLIVLLSLSINVINDQKDEIAALSAAYDNVVVQYQSLVQSMRDEGVIPTAFYRQLMDKATELIRNRDGEIARLQKVVNDLTAQIKEESK